MKYAEKIMVNTTANIISRLTLLGNNTRESAAFKRTCLEAADRLNILHNSLGDLLEDVEDADHNCGDAYCPVFKARQTYCLGVGEYGQL